MSGDKYGLPPCGADSVVNMRHSVADTGFEPLLDASDIGVICHYALKISEPVLYRRTASESHRRAVIVVFDAYPYSVRVNHAVEYLCLPIASSAEVSQVEVSKHYAAAGAGVGAAGVAGVIAA
jgi:hypothetical protein